MLTSQSNGFRHSNGVLGREPEGALAHPVTPPRPLTRGRICFVANDFDGIIRNGGIGTYFYLNAMLLARSGWTVHVLYTAPVEDPAARVSVPARLRAAGVAFHFLEEFRDPMPEDGQGYQNPWFLKMSDRVYHALKALDADHGFDLIEFAEWQAQGFRTVQAKRCGLAFQAADIVVRPHSSSQWQRDGNLVWVAHRDDVLLDYCERYAFEHADVQLSPSAHMLDYLRGVGWRVRDDAEVSFNPFPPPVDRPAARLGPPPNEPLELVFFGRLEVRKGLDLFLEALGGVDPSVPVTFLGKDTRRADGQLATEFIARRLGDRRVKVITDYNREQALDYVTAGNRLAVMASLLDNLPYTVVECVVNRVPFVASAVGGIPELVPDPEARAKLLFAPTAKDLRRCLTDYLRLTPAARRAAHDAAHDAPFVRTNADDVARTYSRLTAAARARAAARPPAPADKPLVTIAVPHYNLGAYLPETLASLAAQTYPNIEVVVVDDGSTDPASLEAFHRLAEEYPEFRFVTQPNAGPGAARNRVLAEARGEFFIPVDADNVAHPRMVEQFVAALRHRPDVTCLTCYLKAFRETADLQAGRWAYYTRFTGGPHGLGALDNVYGDTNAIHRTAALLAIGGYVTEKGTPWEDWETHVRLAGAGYAMDVIPEPLFFYRHRADSRLRTECEWAGYQRVLREYARSGHRPAEADALGLWSFMAGLTRRVRDLEREADAARRAADAARAEADFYRVSAHWLRVQLADVVGSMSYRMSNKLNRLLRQIPAAEPVVKGPFRLARGVRAIAGRRLRREAPALPAAQPSTVPPALPPAPHRPEQKSA